MQLKRAVKRGDVPPPPKQSAKRKRPGGGGERSTAGQLAGAGAMGVGTRKLESRFLKMDKEWLEHARFVASTTPLVRPIPFEAAVLDLPRICGDTHGITLTAPKRPKWKYDQTKKEVEKNEEGLFAKWLKETDESVKRWQRSPITSQRSDGGEDSDPSDEKQVTSTSFERSPTYFERNLEVWRQLWRVTEISQILMVLVDSRAPMIHLPQSLTQYLQGLRPLPEIIFVLTKVDLVGPERTSAWDTYLSSLYPKVQIVRAESYKERVGVSTDGRGAKKFVDPHIPPTLLSDLHSALKLAHKRLLEPPPEVREDERRLKGWKPRVRENIDWDAVLDGGRGNDPQEVSESIAVVSSEEAAEELEKRYITIGLIGQPNVGKSSLLNAIFGTHKVRASRTPGKTKHFQTLFWSPEVRLVDCPGLVFPGLVPLEMQVLAGIIPIAQVASIPSCIQFIGEHIPLENVLSLVHPDAKETDQEDKRTWRTGMEKGKGNGISATGSDVAPKSWTAMDIMIAYAADKGWLTAKAGRPDVNRAGNAILRLCAEGRGLKWGFWPPGSQAKTSQEEGKGIWIEGISPSTDTWDSDSIESGGEQNEAENEGLEESDRTSDSGESGDESEGTDLIAIAGGSRFGALSLNDES